MPLLTQTLVLLDTTSSTIEESSAKLNLNNYLKNNPLPNNVSFEVYGGPGVTAEEIISLAASNNTFQKQHGVIKLGPIQTGISPDTITIIPSFQVDENGDPNNESYLDMQSCNITAPTIIGNYEDNYAYFGDNVFTNTNYFLQSGEIYANGSSRLIWADTGTGCGAQTFYLPYYGGDTYDHSISYYGTGNYGYQEWMMWCFNLTTSAWAYHIETYATGTSLGYSPNTSVFFENHNVNSNWYAGFQSSTVQANNAYDGGYPDGPWANSYFCLPNYSMTGSLTNFGTTNWTLNEIPTAIMQGP